MDSYHHLFQHSKPRFESPAKVFAKLKSKVQREETCVKEPLCSAGQKHGGGFKRVDSTWMTEGLKENQRFAPYRNEAQALTLSPISSPQKTFAYSYSDISRQHVEERPPVADMGRFCTPRKTAFLSSTAVCHPFSVVNKQQITSEPPQIRDSDGFKVINWTPVKVQPVENDCVFEEECVPLDKLRSPAFMFSPMRQRLRKRKVSSSSTKEWSSGVRQPQERKTSSTFTEDNTHTRVEDLAQVGGFSAGRPEISQFTQEPILPPPRSTAKKRCHLFPERNPLMSPAKMFAFMKERESKLEQQGVHEGSSSRRNLIDMGDFRQSRDRPPPTAHRTDEMEDSAFRSAPANCSRVESSDSQSDTEPSEEVPTLTVPPQPVLLEDPLVLNTPRVSIPKKNEAVFKRNKWPQLAKFPSESVIYLKRWFLRRNHKGLFVDGIHREDNIPWNSNIIVDRVSNSVLKTVSGRVYILVGKMNMNVNKDVDAGFPKWFSKKFVNGFPPNWKALYEKFLSESRDSDLSRGTESKNEQRAKTKPEASSVNPPVKQRRQKPFKKPSPPADSPPPASSSSANVSRSGRVIRPPLEYWKGGRVILDSKMNVTIHECYETSICTPVTTSVPARASQKPARVFLPCSEGRKQCDSSSDKEAPVPLRRVKAPARKSNRAKMSHEASYSPESPVETLSSPEEMGGRMTRSRQRFPAAEKTLYVDAVAQKQSKPEKASKQRSKKQTHSTTRPSERVPGSKHTLPASPESPAANDAPQDQSDDDFSFRRKKRGKGGHGKTGVKALKQPGRLSSSEESGQESGKRTSVPKKNNAARTQTKTKNKQKKSTKISPTANPLPASAQSSKKQKAYKAIPQEPDEDKWTEAELLKLQEAVSYYPKHMAGYWAKVARVVGTRSAEECHNQHTAQGTSQTPAKKPKKPPKEKVEAPKNPVTDPPIISARVGTFKRKQQVRQFLEAMPREDVEDVFSSAYMQNKRFEMPSMCPSDDHDITLSEMEPLTPMSTGFPEVKTPQCLHITPGMMGSPNRNNDDKYVFQLQKRMRKNQFNVRKQAPSTKTFTPTPSVKRAMKRCANTENDTFVVWEMFPGNNGALSDSGEEEDFYFSDND